MHAHASDEPGSLRARTAQPGREPRYALAVRLAIVSSVLDLSLALSLASVACVPRRSAAPCPCTCPPAAPSTSAVAVAGTPPPTPPAAGAGASAASPTDATEAYENASEKMNAGDGKGCLAELDAFDATGPKHPTTDPASHFAFLRAQCHMIAGECQKGKALLHTTYTKKMSLTIGPEQIERSVEATLVTYCRNAADLTPREQMLQALHVLQQGAYMTKKDAATCTKAYGTVKALAMVVQPKDDDDTQIKHGPQTLYATASSCLARAGDCAAARKAFDESYPQQNLAKIQDPTVKKQVLQQSFDSIVPKCKGTP